MKIFFKYNPVVMQNEKSEDETSLEILLKSAPFPSKYVIRREFSDRLLQWKNVVSLLHPVELKIQLIHIVEIVKTVWLSHKAVLVQQNTSGIHILNVDFLYFLKENRVDRIIEQGKLGWWSKTLSYVSPHQYGAVHIEADDHGQWE